MIGGVGYYIPVFTAERDDSLTSFYGLRGEENRKKLVNAFKEPTNWIDFCDLVDPNNCTVGDGNSASRYPTTEDEKASYFVQDLYTGHFRISDDNKNCDENANCTGHVVGPQCSWSTYVDSQLYWNNISLASRGPIMPNRGYSFPHMGQIWKAANATKSDVFIWWWFPELLLEEFSDTSAQFQRVTLPTPTEECVDYRKSIYSARCSEDLDERRGEALGSCDYAVIPLKKMMSLGICASSHIPELAKSPAFEFLKQLYVPEYSLPTIFRQWSRLKSNIDVDPPREALCEWVYDNLDELLRYTPAGYPRELKSKEYHVLSLIGIILGSLAFVLVGLTGAFTYRWRAHQVLQVSQLNVLSAMLCGKKIVLLLVA